MLIQDRFPAYISGERCEAIQHRLANNRATAEALGAPREGPSLLGGLLVGGRCGRRLIPASSGRANRLRYSCSRSVSDDGAPLCLSLAGAFLDRCVVAQMLHVLQLASLEVSIAADHALRTERAPLEAQWQQRLERSHYEAERAARQYAAVEPENRLVARALERRWEEALRQAQQGQEDYARFHREQPPELTRQERDAIGRLAQDVPALWEASETTTRDRQAMVRLWLARVTIDVPGASAHVSVTIHWASGVRSEHRVIRPVARYDQLSTSQVLLDRIDT